MTRAEPRAILTSEAGGRAVLLAVRVQPGARRARCAGGWNGMLKLAVSAPSESGRANQAAAALLAELFGLRAAAVQLVSGPRSRSKVFRLSLAPGAARARLAELLASSATTREGT